MKQWPSLVVTVLSLSLISWMSWKLYTEPPYAERLARPIAECRSFGGQPDLRRAANGNWYIDHCLLGPQP